MPLVSIVLCTYNSLEFIDQCLESLLTQSYNNIELVVVDDGSTDGTIDILEKINDPRLVVHCLAKNHGLIHARNKGFEMARGQYIAIMDSDDIAAKNRIECQLKFMIDNKIDVCGSFYRTLEVAKNKMKSRTAYINDADIRALLTIYCPICNPTVMFKREILDSHRYREKYQHAEDYAFWCELASHGFKFGNAPHALLTYRVHAGQVSQQKMVQARHSFELARNNYVQRLMDGMSAPRSIPFLERCRSGLQYIKILNHKIGGISYRANYEIYAEFQYRRNGIMTPILRLERAMVALWGSICGKFRHAEKVTAQ